MSKYNPDFQSATGEEVAHYLASFNVAEKMNLNWGLDTEKPSIWQIPYTNSYINGIMATIDKDLEVSYLVQVCDKVNDNDVFCAYMALEISTFPYFVVKRWSWHESNPHPFFERPESLTNYDLHFWFINWEECNREVTDAS